MPTGGIGAVCAHGDDGDKGKFDIRTKIVQSNARICCFFMHRFREKYAMSLACVQSRALLGLQAPSVIVEVHLANGLPSVTLVGLAETEVKEARERVRCAIANSGLEFPTNKRITVNLAPADLPKDTGRFVMECSIC